jgi:UDP-N-acetylmuramoylalanine--D-glutamate ligase
MSNWKSFFEGKRVTVMGLGLLGRGVGDISFIAKYAKEIIVTDLKSKKELKESIEQLKDFKNIQFVLGEHRLEDFENRDFVIKAAGVPLDSEYIAHAHTNNVPVYMSTALFAKLSSAKIIGVTGTRGKTTVTYMLYEILKAAYKGKKQKVLLGGNIQGVATLPLLQKVKRGDVVVLELDSWQLQGFGDLKISPNISVFTTFMPDHLNYYKGDLRQYFEDKAKIFLNQKKGDIFVAGEQLCSLPTSLIKMLPKSTKFISERALPKKFKLGIPGEHNIYNAALAFTVARIMKVPVGIIQKNLEKFKGVPGRLQKVGTFHGVDIYNDTTATTPHALVAALEALGKNRNIVLIAGGSDKTIDLEVLRIPLSNYCRDIFLLKGSGTDRLIKESIIPPVISPKIFSNLKKAVLKAVSTVQKGDIVLLSPGFASFGMFQNEYDRGDQFVSIVKEIKNS